MKKTLSAFTSSAIVSRMGLVIEGDEGRSKNLARAATVSCSAHRPGKRQKACSRIL